MRSTTNLIDPIAAHIGVDDGIFMESIAPLLMSYLNWRMTASPLRSSASTMFCKASIEVVGASYVVLAILQLEDIQSRFFGGSGVAHGYFLPNNNNNKYDKEVKKKSGKKSMK